MHYLSVEHVVQIHSFVVDETGGLHGIRDRGRIESLVARPAMTSFGRDLYPTVFDKAACYIHSIIHDHPFVDGNKRAAMTAGFVSLENNGYIATARMGSIEQFALQIAQEKLDVPAISAWLKKHSRKQKSN